MRAYAVKYTFTTLAVLGLMACSNSDEPTAPPQLSDAFADVRAIVTADCSGCHGDGSGGPSGDHGLASLVGTGDQQDPSQSLDTEDSFDEPWRGPWLPLTAMTVRPPGSPGSRRPARRN